MLQADTRYVRAWIKLCERIIRAHKKEENDRPRESRLLESFVQWKPKPKPKRAKIKKQTPHQKQDLRPDWQSAHCPHLSAVSGSTSRIDWRDRTINSSFVVFFPWVASTCPSDGRRLEAAKSSRAPFPASSAAPNYTSVFDRGTSSKPAWQGSKFTVPCARGSTGVQTRGWILLTLTLVDCEARR
jgi:hypothetical protein